MKSGDPIILVRAFNKVATRRMGTRSKQETDQKAGLHQVTGAGDTVFCAEMG
jgi:hypothetical protein